MSSSALKYKHSFDDTTKNATIASHTAPDSAALTTIDKGINIAIVGGGIGGMALALSLADARFTNLDIYESVPAISELGVGINIQPHAIRELYELGLGEELAKTGIPTHESLYYHKKGQFIYGESRGLGAGYNWPQYSMHRGSYLDYYTELSNLRWEKIESILVIRLLIVAASQGGCTLKLVRETVEMGIVMMNR